MDFRTCMLIFSCLLVEFVNPSNGFIYLAGVLAASHRRRLALLQNRFRGSNRSINEVRGIEPVSSYSTYGNGINNNALPYYYGYNNGWRSNGYYYTPSCFCNNAVMWQQCCGSQWSNSMVPNFGYQSGWNG
jgi:hypothetical protein